MSWTVIIEDCEGDAIKTLPEEFELPKLDILYNGNFKLVRYLDPYSDITFNTLMMDDLISDLTALKKELPSNTKQINEVIELAMECKSEPQTFLKFYGD